MSRTAKILAGASLDYIQMALATVFGLWFTPFLLSHLGAHDFGLWSTAMPMLTYIGLIDFGIVTLLQRDLAYALGSAGGDAARSESMSQIVGRARRLVFLQLPLLCLIASALWVCVPASWAAIRWPLALVLSAFVLNFPLRISGAVMYGMQDFGAIGRLSLLSWALTSAANVVLIVHGWGLMALAVSWSAPRLLISAVQYVRVRRKFPMTIPRGKAELSAEHVRGQLRKGGWIIIGQLGAIMTAGADVMIVAALLGPVAVTQYTITDKVITLLTSIPLSFASLAQSGLSELSTSRERSRLPEVCAALTLSVLLASGLLAAVTIAVNQGFVGLWVNREQFAGRGVLLALVGAMVLWHWYVSTTYTLFAFGHEKTLAVVTLINGIGSTALMYGLMKWIGLVGAPLGSIIGFAIVGIPTNLIVIARATEIRVTALLRPLVPWGVRFALLAVFAEVIARAFAPQTWPTVIAAASVICLAYGALMFPVALEGPLGKYVRPRLAALQQRVPWLSR